MYIGPVVFPYIKSIKKGTKKDVRMIWGAGLNHPIPFESLPGVNEVTIEGTLVKNSTYTKSLANQVEDILSLKYSDVAYNYIESTDLNGYLSVKSVDLEINAEKTSLRDVSIVGDLYPNSIYQRKYTSDPVILTNDFSITLGSLGADNYIALPIGATYSGGDGSTITRTGKDGTITLVKATTNNDVAFDLSTDEVNVGECKVWDDMGSAIESDWVRVFNIDHEFTGNCVIENGLIRLKNVDTLYPDLYVYANSTWNLVTTEVVEQLIAEITTLVDFTVTKITPDEIKVKRKVKNSFAETTTTWTLSRGAYGVYIQGKDSTLTNIRTGTTIQWELSYSPGSSIIDKFLGVGSASASTDNYVVAFDTDRQRSFLTFMLVMGGGKGAYNHGNTDAVYWNPLAGSKSFMGAIPFTTSNLFKECEAMTQGTGVTYYTGIDASPKTGNTGSILDAQNENVYYTFTGGTDLPLGTYKLFVRAKDSAAVAGDLGIYIDNNTDSTQVITPTVKTLTTSWAYYSVDVTLASDDNGDTIQVKLNKETANVNTIDLDYILWVPITLDDGNGPRDIAHQALVNQNLKRILAQR